MAKIIGINNNVITIGMEDRGIKEVRASDINFVPHLGDEVEIFETETRIIVSKLEKIDTLSDADINNYNKTLVSKAVYCILAFIFGGIGVHKFYAGKILGGLLYLFFCWTFIPSFLSVIDFIIGLCQNSDSGGKIRI